MKCETKLWYETGIQIILKRGLISMNSWPPAFLSTLAHYGKNTYQNAPWVFLMWSYVLCVTQTGLTALCGAGSAVSWCVWTSEEISYCLFVSHCMHSLLCFITWKLLQWFLKSFHHHGCLCNVNSEIQRCCGRKNKTTDSQHSAASLPVQKQRLCVWHWVCVRESPVRFFFLSLSAYCDLYHPSLLWLSSNTRGGSCIRPALTFLSHTEHSRCDHVLVPGSTHFHSMKVCKSIFLQSSLTLDVVVLSRHRSPKICPVTNCTSRFLQSKWRTWHRSWGCCGCCCGWQHWSGWGGPASSWFRRRRKRRCDWLVPPRSAWRRCQGFWRGTGERVRLERCREETASPDSKPGESKKYILKDNSAKFCQVCSANTKQLLLPLTLVKNWFIN